MPRGHGLGESVMMTSLHDAVRSGDRPSAGTGSRILIVSFRFPPYQSVGAVSVGKTAKYLAALGHDVRVVTARDQLVPRTLPVEIDRGSVVSTGWLDPSRGAAIVSGGRGRVAETGFSASANAPGFVRRVGRAYRNLMIPDTEIGWGWPAFRAGRRLARDWVPEVIYASAPPYTALFVARAVATRTRIPWVAGLRDLWSDYPHRGRRRGRLDRILESRVLGTAAGVVVTTEEAAEVLRARSRMPVATVMNGYDPDDLRDRTAADDPHRLRIVHTGVLMHERRDPSPLFDAMRQLRERGRTVVAEFYGRDSALAETVADRTGVHDLVSVVGPIPYGDSLQAQRDADVLLLLQTNDPAERHTCPAKLFEYAAARRPVLCLGPDDGVVARLVRQHHLGVVARHPDDIARELRRWCDLKERTGSIPDVSAEPPVGLSRQRQVQRLDRFLRDVVLTRVPMGGG
jgi:glycosyltransferase involved in cell wall biosynthesis